MEYSTIVWKRSGLPILNWVLDRSTSQQRGNALIRKDSGPVPNAVSAAADIVAKEPVRGADGAPMARRVPPALNAIDARIDQILIGPTFSDHFTCSACTDLRAYLVESRFPLVMPLYANGRLMLRMMLGSTGQRRGLLAIRALRVLGMGPNRPDHCPLRESASR